MLAFQKIKTGVTRFCRGLATVAMVVIFAIMLVLVADIILRFATKNMAIRGTYELTEMAMVIIIFLSFAVTQLEKEHIHVVMLTDRFPFRVRTFVNAVISTLTTALSAAVFYACVLLTLGNMASRVTTAVLYVPYWPFCLLMSLGMLSLTVVLLLDTVEYFIAGIGNVRPGGTGA